jgi:predicted ATPase/class 3 adenylate cyclase
MSARPTGTVTFLFTDIEGSTQRWERDPEAMSSALKRHDALMRDSIGEHGGVVFKIVGDAFCAAFSETPPALEAALHAQRAMRAADFSKVGGMRVRMALHTGHAEERDGDYLGPAVNRVARLLAVGHGGQILVSGTAADLARDAISYNGSLFDLGAHRLKDLTRPERIYQLVAPDLVETFPPLHTLELSPNNLPPQLTSFMGRDRELGEIRALLVEHHLITIVGTGGAGKTRCALQVAAEVADGYSDGVWLVELAPIGDPSLVTTAIAQALNVREAPHEPLLDTLLSSLQRRTALLVIDNCEHLIGEVRNVAAAILRACSGIRILATSRESLNIAGERVFRLPSLAVPPHDRPLSAEAVETYGAVALFADRARAANERFILTDENVPFVVEIVERVDGIPLAIELAAARANVVSPQQLSKRLSERFRVLTGGDRSALPRQQTLRATIDWSFDLLDAPERALFRRLAVFAGGWTLEAATEVCRGDSLDEWEILGTLSSLVDKSLIVADSAESNPRFRMLSTIRDYALERLTEAAEEDEIAQAHARYYAALVNDLQSLVSELEDEAWRCAARDELDNIRAAIDRTIFRGHGSEIGLKLLADLEWPELITTPREALHWFETAAGLTNAMPDELVHARLLRHCLLLEWLVGRPVAQLERTALRALDIARKSGDPDEIAHALANLGACYRSTARFDEAERMFTEAYAKPESLSRITTNGVLRLWAVTDLQRSDVERARLRFSQVVALERPASEAHASALLNLGELEFATGNVDAARENARQARETYARLNSIYLVLVLSNLAAYALAVNDLEDARTHLREALPLQKKFGSGWLAHLIEQHALLAALLGDHVRAAMLAGFTDAQYKKIGEVRQHTERVGSERLRRLLAEVYEEEDLTSHLSAGARLLEEQALAAAAAIHTPR